jgi:hypothetical protein
MRQKRLKQLRKLAKYDCHAEPVYKGKAHGVREKISTFTAKANGKAVKIPIALKYQAITVINESKLNYRVAKKAFRKLKKTFNK